MDLNVDVEHLLLSTISSHDFSPLALYLSSSLKET